MVGDGLADDRSDTPPGAVRFAFKLRILLGIDEYLNSPFQPWHTHTLACVGSVRRVALRVRVARPYRPSGPEYSCPGLTTQLGTGDDAVNHTACRALSRRAAVPPAGAPTSSPSQHSDPRNLLATAVGMPLAARIAGRRANLTTDSV